MSGGTCPTGWKMSGRAAHGWKRANCSENAGRSIFVRYRRDRRASSGGDRPGARAETDDARPSPAWSARAPGEHLSTSRGRPHRARAAWQRPTTTAADSIGRVQSTIQRIELSGLNSNAESPSSSRRCSQWARHALRARSVARKLISTAFRHFEAEANLTELSLSLIHI